MKGPCKMPSKWTSKFCSKFIIEVVELIEKDEKISNDSPNATRKSNRNKNKQSSLPPAAARLVAMVNVARLKLKEEEMSTMTGNRKRKSVSSAGKTKTVKDYLLNSDTVYNPDYIEVTCNDIECNLLCPICNHRSLVSLTTKEQADAENSRIQDAYRRKLDKWNAKRRIGSKPRMTKTHSQILGCMCYSQNCIGNSDGSGCFKCKDENVNSQKVFDKRYVKYSYLLGTKSQNDSHVKL